MGVLLGGSESLSFRNRSAIGGEAPTWIGGRLFYSRLHRGREQSSCREKENRSSSAANFHTK